MILSLATVVAVLIGAVVAFVATRPKVFTVQRSITVRAERETVFPLINDLRSWDKWSDDGSAAERAVQKAYGVSSSGAGATAEWHGSGRSGAAKMLVTESTAPSRVSVQVDWLKPFKAHNLNEFELRARGSDTEVIWLIRASNLYPMRLVGIVVDMKAAFGRHMEAALGRLKHAAEVSAR